MRAKEYLERVRLLDLKIDQDKELLEDMIRMEASLPSMDYSKVRVQSSPEGDSTSTAAMAIFDKSREIDREIQRFLAEKGEIITMINGLDDVRYIEVLTMTYVRYRSTKRRKVTQMEMSKSMHYHERYIQRLHREALKAFEERWPQIADL